MSVLLWLFQYLPFDTFGYQKAKRKAESGIQFALNQIELHRQEINYDNPARDFIDSYLLKQRERKDEPGSVFNSEYMGIYYYPRLATSHELSPKKIKKVKNFNSIDRVKQRVYI